MTDDVWWETLIHFAKTNIWFYGRNIFRLNHLNHKSNWQFCANIRFSVSHLMLDSGYMGIFYSFQFDKCEWYVLNWHFIQVFLMIIKISFAICIQKRYGSCKLHTSIYNKCNLLLFRFHFQLLLTLLLYISGNYTLISLNFSIITRLYGNVTHLQ